MLCKVSEKVMNNTFSQNFSNVTIHGLLNENWRLTSFYGFQNDPDNKIPEISCIIVRSNDLP
jgi:hypothetical protein